MATVPNLCFRCGGSADGAVSDLKGRRICLSCVETSTGGGHEIIDLSPHVADDIIPLVPQAHTHITRAPCPHCNTPMKPGQTKCPACGLNPASFEERVSTRGLREVGGVGREAPKGEPLRCKQCEYDLTGLKALVCPECGTRNTLPSRSEYLNEVSEEVARWEYRKPALMAVIGFVLSLIITAIADGWANAAWFAAIFPVRVGVATGAFVLCGLMWVGLDAPLKLTLLRFAGILGLVDLGSTLLAASGLPFSGFVTLLGGGILYVYLLVELFDLDIQDAWGVSVVTFVVNAITLSLVFGGLSLI